MNIYYKWILFLITIGISIEADAQCLKTAKFLHDIGNNAEFAAKMKALKGSEYEKMVKAWDILDDAGTALKTDVIALDKIYFLKDHGLSDAQLLKIGQLDDIKAINIADDLAKRTNPSVPINQLDLIPSNAKALEGVRPTIMDEISSMAANTKLKNPDGLHSFLDNAVLNPNKPGWQYELDIAIETLENGSDIAFSKQVETTIDGVTKEVDILVYSNGGQIIEIKHHADGTWVTIGKNFGKNGNNGLGFQLGKIHQSVLDEFDEHIGRMRITGNADEIWRLADEQTLIDNLKAVRLQYPDQIEYLDNASKFIIHNDNGIYTIPRSAWQ